jgi:hypothetical protein
MRYSLTRNPKYVLADAGYSSRQLAYLIKRQYRAEPIIDPDPKHPAAVKRQQRTKDWKAPYKQRVAAERVNSRMKAFYKLNCIWVRGKQKVMLHVLLSAIALEARAIAFPQELRHCVQGTRARAAP